MRLTDFEKNTIKKTAQDIFGPDARIFLFGSRVKDHEKGGDIDLYIETDKHSCLQDKISFLSNLKFKLGDQKIDAIINSPNQHEKNIFKIAKETGIQI